MRLNTSGGGGIGSGARERNTPNTISIDSGCPWSAGGDEDCAKTMEEQRFELIALMGHQGLLNKCPLHVPLEVSVLDDILGCIIEHILQRDRRTNRIRESERFSYENSASDILAILLAVRHEKGTMRRMWLMAGKVISCFFMFKAHIV